MPLLDHKVVELSAQIPSNYKINNTNQKLILKNAFKDLIYNEILNNKKQGFSLPLSMWFRKELKDYVGDILLSKNSSLLKYFNYNEINNIVKYHNKGIRDFSAKIWSLLFLEEWMKKNRL